MKLAGLRVLDMSLFLPGPHLSMMMADHGAEVIALEPPGGEPVRQIGLRQGGHSVWFRNTHRGKRSLSLDLKTTAGREALLRVAERCDVLLEAFRPGVVQRLGVDYAQVAARNPRIVYCSISAFGQNGPLRDKPAHDLAVEALSGLLACNLGSDGEPVNAHLPAADMAASLMALSGILMALYRREQNGLGDYLDIAMLDSLMAWTPNVTGPVFAEQRAPVPAEERSFGGNAFYRIYRTGDGRHLVLGGSEQKFVINLLRALGREDLATLHAQGPGSHQQQLINFLNSCFAEQPLSHWQDFLAGIDLCWAPLLDLQQAFAQPQVAARGMLSVDDEGNAHIGVPIRFQNEPAQPRQQLPETPGQDSLDILRECGLDETALRELQLLP